MSWAFVVAGSACSIVALGHSIAGERLLVIPLLRLTNVPALLGSDDIARQTLRLTWHIVSIMALAFAALFFFLSTIELDSGGQIAAYSIGAIFIVATIWLVLISRGRHPAWLLFLTIAVASFVGVS